MCTEPAANLSVNASLTLTCSFYKTIQYDRESCANSANSGQKHRLNVRHTYMRGFSVVFWGVHVWASSWVNKNCLCFCNNRQECKLVQKGTWIAVCYLPSINTTWAATPPTLVKAVLFGTRTFLKSYLLKSYVHNWCWHKYKWLFWACLCMSYSMCTDLYICFVYVWGSVYCLWFTVIMWAKVLGIWNLQ